MHLGHAFAAVYAFRLAERTGGEFLLRIEDIDTTRSRPEWERLIEEDLHWLGLDWPHPTMRQSERMETYRDALRSLWSLGLLYQCHCSRRDIEEALRAPQQDHTLGPDGPVYPGTCRDLIRPRALPDNGNLRLDMKNATQEIDMVTYREHCLHGDRQEVSVPRQTLIDQVGDVVLARHTMGTSYHLSVVIDDAEQQITDVTRGADLGEATWIHVVLQRLLGLSTPRYHHHRLITDQTGKRLAKRDDARALSTYRAEGATPSEILRMVGLQVTDLT